MNKLWPNERPIVAFYVLCYAISLGLWLPRIALPNEFLEILGAVGLFGPALACVFVARATPARAQLTRANHPWIPFVLAWSTSGLILAANTRAASSGTSPAIFAVIAALALVPAYVISSAFSGLPGVREALSSLIRPRGW